MTSRNRNTVAFACFCGVYLWYRALGLPGMCAQLRTAQVGCALCCFSPGFLFSLFDSVRTPRLIFIEIEMNSIYDCTFRFHLDTP